MTRPTTSLLHDDSVLASSNVLGTPAALTVRMNRETLEEIEEIVFRSVVRQDRKRDEQKTTRAAVLSFSSLLDDASKINGSDRGDA